MATDVRRYIFGEGIQSSFSSLSLTILCAHYIETRPIYTRFCKNLLVMKFPCTLLKSQPIQPFQNLEDKKVIIETSRWNALSRAIIHMVPVSISTVLIALNLKHCYIGPSLGSESGPWTATHILAILQVGAKAQVPTNVRLSSACDSV